MLSMVCSNVFFSYFCYFYLGEKEVLPTFEAVGPSKKDGSHVEWIMIMDLDNKVTEKICPSFREQRTLHCMMENDLKIWQSHTNLNKMK